jgi:hypothetical protein
MKYRTDRKNFRIKQEMAMVDHQATGHVDK